MEKYLEMLTFMRPAGGVWEDAFVEKYLREPHRPIEDGYGNQIIDVGSKPNIVWSSHTDTVHYKGGLQNVIVTKKDGHARVAPGQKLSNCLGADCTTGVWLMLEMIEAGIAGRYIFHRAEERGMLGSTWLAKNAPEWLKGIDAAIAFDRMGTTDVITNQCGNTASNEFATSLSSILGGAYKPSPNGVYTDTKAYAKIVSECTNISVGYYRQHSSQESQDLNHLKWLRDRMVQFDASTLVFKRDPAAAPADYDPYDFMDWDQSQ
ncbi:MAG: M28 family peptidase [Mesorhizobium sp.]|uniref:M28 family peptidase n=1 Tax=Mesorhizobium sp. TaxID=1871066 RepID=UPI000FE55DEE|nr:M28 family peptidase [Mesorhizobium sp.]RWB08823.1 MAG: M28 family peptidase [Mesorhizobium sp.]RWB13527.1 MAG: M28 family peptidase [Mesorhizobium sp.]